MNFRLWLESSSVVNLRLIGLDARSTGTYSWGDQEGSPAGDPREGYADWDFSIDPKEEHGKIVIIDKMLKGYPVVIIENPEGGSYHERWVSSFVYVTVTPELVEKMAEEEEVQLPTFDLSEVPNYRCLHGPTRGSRKVLQFPYTTFDDVIERVVKFANYSPPKGYEHLEKLKGFEYTGPEGFEWEPDKGETREQYWTRMISQVVNKMPRKYEGD